MQSVYYNNGSIRLNRERATMVSCWEAGEVARWIEGLAGIEPNVSGIFLREKINGVGLSILLREDLIRMGIEKLDQQLILLQSIENLTSLVEQLQNENLAFLFMRIQSAAANFLSLLKFLDKDEENKNNNRSITSPEIYASLSHLSETIVTVCHWLGRLPFIEIVKFIDLRQKIIKDLIQIRKLIRHLRNSDSTKIIKSNLILEIRRLKSDTESLIRREQDSLFFSDRYLTRVHLRRPDKNDVNIEYTTMPDFTHVISSIETQAVGQMGTGFGAINVGDEIIEINNQVVIGWDPIHFDDLLRTSLRQNEIYLLVKKMPRHKNEVGINSLMQGSNSCRRLSPRGLIQLREKREDDTRARLMEQEREIEIESEDETLYQSKRSSLKKPDQHSSLPDLLEPMIESATIFNKDENAETKSITSEQSLSSMKSSKGHFCTFLRSRPDAKSIIPEQDENVEKGQPKLVTRRILEGQLEEISSSSKIADEDFQNSMKNNETNKTKIPFAKNSNQINSQRSPSPFPSITNFFRSGNETPERSRKKQNKEQKKTSSASTPKMKHQISNSFSSQTSMSSRSVFSNFETSNGTQRGQKEKRFLGSRTIACKDLGEGDCEGFLKRHPPKGTFAFQWRMYWCVLKAGILFVFKSKDDPIQDIEIKLEGKNISPAPEKRKYAFRVSDEQNTTREYFCCSSRDEMAKWMNKMGLAAINFEINDSKIAGFNKGFINSRENSPVSTPKFLRNLFALGNKKRSTGESEIESDKDSFVSDFDTSKEQNPKGEFLKIRSSSSASISKGLNFVKTHHRTSSSPVNFTTNFVQENQQFYVRSFSRRSESESSNDIPFQRSFYSTEISNGQTPNENLMLNSSGGFSMAAPLQISSPTNTQIETFSPGFTLSQPEQTSENQIFTFDDQNQDFPLTSSF